MGLRNAQDFGNRLRLLVDDADTKLAMGQRGKRLRGEDPQRLPILLTQTAHNSSNSRELARGSVLPNMFDHRADDAFKFGWIRRRRLERPFPLESDLRDMPDRKAEREPNREVNIRQIIEPGVEATGARRTDRAKQLMWRHRGRPQGNRKAKTGLPCEHREPIASGSGQRK